MTRRKSATCACRSALAIAALGLISQVNAQPAEQRAPGMMGPGGNQKNPPLDEMLLQLIDRCSLDV